jgi:hypothetical protein
MKKKSRGSTSVSNEEIQKVLIKVDEFLNDIYEYGGRFSEDAKKIHSLIYKLSKKLG